MGHLIFGGEVDQSDSYGTMPVIRKNGRFTLGDSSYVGFPFPTIAAAMEAAAGLVAKDGDHNGYFFRKDITIHSGPASNKADSIRYVGLKV